MDHLHEEDDHGTRELHLYASNHADLHRQRLTPIHKNLRNKQAAGTYDSNKAHRAFSHAAKDAADRYHKEHGHRFDKKTRDAVAAKMRDEFERDSAAGEHDHLLHKKHQKKKTNDSYEYEGNEIMEEIHLEPHEYLAIRILEQREAAREEVYEDVIDEDYIIEQMIIEGYSDEEIVEVIESIQE